MQSISNLFGAFSLKFEVAGENGLITIHPEMVSAMKGIKPRDSG